MSVHTQTNQSLKVVIGGTAYECQWVTAEFTPPGVEAGSTVMTACPDGVVSEPGAAINGKLTGDAYTDTQAAGMWTALYTAYTTQAELDYVLEFFPETAAEHLIFTGRAVVSTPPTLSFAKPGISRHPVELSLLTAAMTRPTP